MLRRLGIIGLMIVALSGSGIVPMSAKGQGNEQYIPELLEEITLDNIDELMALAQFNVNRVRDLSWSSDGTYLAASTDEGVWIYGVSDGELVPQLIEFDNSVYATFIPGSHHFLAGRKVYDAETLETVGNSAIDIDAFSHDGTMYVVAEDAEITVYDAKTNQKRLNVPVNIPSNCEYGCYITDVIFSPNDNQLAFSSSDTYTESGAIEVSTGKIVHIPLFEAWSLSYSSDGSMIAYSKGHIGRETREAVMIADGKTGDHIGAVNVSGDFNAPAFSRDGQLLVIGGTNYDAPNPQNAYGMLYFFDMKTVLQQSETEATDAIRIETFDGWVTSPVFSPDFHLLASGYANYHHADGQVTIWGVPSSE